MTKRDKLVILAMLLMAIFCVILLSVNCHKPDELPVEWHPVVCKWQNGRETLSMRVGEYYYTYGEHDVTNQHVGWPESWRYAN
jgi:hypothetical protein